MERGFFVVIAIALVVFAVSMAVVFAVFYGAPAPAALLIGAAATAACVWWVATRTIEEPPPQ